MLIIGETMIRPLGKLPLAVHLFSSAYTQQGRVSVIPILALLLAAVAYRTTLQRISIRMSGRPRRHGQGHVVSLWSSFMTAPCTARTSSSNRRQIQLVKPVRLHRRTPVPFMRSRRFLFGFPWTCAQGVSFPPPYLEGICLVAEERLATKLSASQHPHVPSSLPVDRV